jgi:hypothetical protein
MKLNGTVESVSRDGNLASVGGHRIIVGIKIGTYSTVTLYLRPAVARPFRLGRKVVVDVDFEVPKGGRRRKGSGS